MPVLTEAQKNGILMAANLGDEELVKCRAIHCLLPYELQTSSGKGVRKSCPVTYNKEFSEAQFLLNTNLNPALEDFQIGLHEMGKVAVTAMSKKIPPACHRLPFV